ncbi:hypothetical protein O0L34_g7172 [Tuta absoluta]|nr:hypothetical protein O0L34_g7172 [Tuta absoluta]
MILAYIVERPNVVHDADFAKLLLGMRLGWVAGGWVRDEMRRGLTGDGSHLLRPDVQEVRERQRARDQLPALLEIERVETVGPGPAHRRRGRGGRAQRHVNYERPCRTLDIAAIQSTHNTVNQH